METFAEKLKRMRDEKSLSQQELAQKIFVSRSAVAKWEQGRGFPSVASLQYIAAEFGVTIDELVSDREIAILQIEKDKKLSLRTKLLIAMSAVLAVILVTIITVSVVYTVMYRPRSLSEYLELEASEIDAVYLKYATEEEEKEVYLDANKTELFLDCLKHTKVVPEWDSYKVTSSYRFFIVSKEYVYELDNFQLCVLKSGELVKAKEYSLYSGKLSYLVYLFDIPENDMEHF